LRLLLTSAEERHTPPDGPLIPGRLHRESPTAPAQTGEPLQAACPDSHASWRPLIGPFERTSFFEIILSGFGRFQRIEPSCADGSPTDRFETRRFMKTDGVVPCHAISQS